jgi:hypothetical protein
MESALMRVLPPVLAELDLLELELLELDLVVLVRFTAPLENTPDADCSGVPTPLPPEINCARNVAPARWFEGQILNSFRIGDPQ